MSVIVFGSISMDLTTYTAHLPAPGETLFGHSFVFVPGGKGGNQAVAASRLGTTTKFFGRVGKDSFGEQALSILTSYGVDMSGVYVDAEHDTGLAIITVDDQAENAIIVVSGANMALGQSDVERCLPQLEQAKVLLLQLEVPLDTVIAMASAARERDVTVVLDPAPVRDLPDELYPLIDIITPNEVEAEMLLGYPIDSEEAAVQAALDLRERGIGTAIIKMGGQGAYYHTSDAKGWVPAFKVEAVDTVAAGDAFNGGLAVALAEGQTLAEAVRWGAAAGALAVTKAGASSSMPQRAAFDELLQKG